MPRVSGRSLVNALVMTALAAELLFLLGHLVFGWGTRGYPPTPRPLAFQPPAPPSGGDVLLRLSAVAASHASPAWPPDAPYATVTVRAWRLHGRAGGGGLRGRTSTSSRRRGGVPALPATMPALAAAPALAAMLDAGRRGGGWAPGWELVALTGLTQTEPVPAATQSMLLRLLAGVPGLVNNGTTTDRSGRTGQAVSLVSDYSGEPITYTLIFDSATGDLLESDDTLAGSPHHLHVPAGAVIAYTTFISSRYTAAP
ncbi:MAG TPA: hypothetical protein VGH67_17535 [Solirubrobacteraceae bacterium]|jgi:hypothetical protein